MDAAIFGLIVADVIASPLDARSPPPSGGLQFLQRIELTSGGNVCNTGIAMARLGLRVAAAGAVGRDALGAALIDRLKQAGLDVGCVVADDRAQTSATVVAVEPGGERSFFHVPGATTLLDAGALRRCFPLFARCEIVQIGYFGLLPALTPELPNLLSELREVAPRVKLALDTVNPPAARELLDPILPHVDVFCPSRSEAAALTGESDPQAMVASFRPLMPPGSLVGIKLDAEGCFLDDGAASCFCPAYKVNVVDTTGAGDTWFGGLLTALHRRMPLEQSGRFANRAAADCCTALGASAGVRSFDETFARI
ncbi:MAG TPA: carbohydrate kinase family protein [Tepidisphaeraceae bacterium]|nr:carbohydrate kinase family protein [Tepidisphaeraceae bacterium]